MATAAMTATRIALVASLAATGLAAAPSTAQARPHTAQFEAAVAAFRAAHPEVGATEAVRRIDGQADRARLLERLGRGFPGTFGGSWYDGDTGIQHLQATSPAAARAFTALAAQAGVAVEVHAARFSHRQLRHEFQLLNSGAHPVLGAAARNRTGIDVEANRVVVAVPEADVAAVRAELAAGAATTVDMVRVIASSGADAVEDACVDRRNCGVPMRSGIILWQGQYANAACSLGFTASASDGSHWAVTAGHCGAVNSLWGHGQQAIGPMRQARNTGSVDVGRIRIDSAYWRQSTWGWFFNARDPNTPVPVDYAISAESTIQAGDTVCLSAWHSRIGLACGTVAEVNDPDVRGMVRVRGFDACGGDSGGGWYWLSSTGARWAYGIHSRSSSGCHGSGGNSWFSSLPDINAFWDGSSAARIRVDYR